MSEVSAPTDLDQRRLARRVAELERQLRRERSRNTGIARGLDALDGTTRELRHVASTLAAELRRVDPSSPALDAMKAFPDPAFKVRQ